MTIALVSLALAAAGSPDLARGDWSRHLEVAAYPVLGFPAPDSFWTANTLSLEISGPANSVVLVRAQIAGDQTAENPVVGRGTIGPDGVAATVIIGGATSEAGPLPDEATVTVSVEWYQGTAQIDQQTLGDLRVDTRGPRFVEALAPAGDFYANLPDPDTPTAIPPEQASQISFYAAQAFDLGTDPSGSETGIQYRVRLWRREADGTLTFLYEQPWPGGTCPVETMAVGATESFSGIPTLARGRYPRNVWSRSGSNLQAHLGTGEYVWVVEARDAAGNVSTSAPCDVWVAYAGESLWGNLYDDTVSRLRAIVWMPKDHLVPASATNLNGEWSPYVDHPKVTDPTSAVYRAQASWSPRVFHGTAEERNRQYAQYTWIHARRWQMAFDNYASEAERQARMPGGPGFAPYYPIPYLTPSDRLHPNYPTLADGRLRIEILRDPKITEEMLYNQWKACRDGLLTPGEQYLGVGTKLDSMLGGNIQTLMEKNVLALIQDWGGFVWLWYSPGWNVNSTGDNFAPTTVWSGPYPAPSGVPPETYQSPWSAWALQDEGGSASEHWHSQGAGGSFGTSWLHSINRPDPLEAYLGIRGQPATVGTQAFSSGASYLQNWSLVDLASLKLNDSTTAQFSLVQRDFPLFEDVDGRYAGPGGLPSPVHGSPAGHYFSGDDSYMFPREDLLATGPTWSSQESSAVGHSVHEMSHALDIPHETTMNRGPEIGIGWIMQTAWLNAFGMYQTSGLDPLRSGGSYCEPLLGIPEVDVKLLKDHGGAPTVGWHAMAHFSPATVTGIVTHPVFNLWKSRDPGAVERERVDPVGRLAWPRDAAYIKLHDKDQPVNGYTISDFPSVYSVAEDYGSDASGLAFSRTVFAFLQSRDVPFQCAKSASESTLLPWSARPLHLFTHSAEDIGYFDCSADVPQNPEWVFRYPGPVVISLETSDWAGNVGCNGKDFVQVLYDHEKDQAAGGPSHDQIRYVAAGQPAGTAGGDGTLSNPYLSIDYAISRELSGVRTFVLLPGEHFTVGIGGATVTGQSRLPDYDHWKFLGGGATPADVVLRPVNPDTVLFDFSYDTTPGSGNDYGVIRTHDLVIGNMTLSGDAVAGGNARQGIVIHHCHEGHLGNLVIRDMTEDGIYVHLAHLEGLWVTNNTIVDCGRGITVDYAADPLQSQNIRVHRLSFVEDNLVANCAEYAIKIGLNSYPERAAAWDPFPNAYSDALGSTPIVPVSYNIVWHCGQNASATYDPRYAFLGDDWYRSDTYPESTSTNPDLNASYGPIRDRRFLVAGNREFHELWLDDTIYTETDLFQNYAAGDYRPANGSPIIGAGSPYRLDKIKGTGGREDVLLRRSVGALLPTESQAHQWLYDNTLNGSTMGRYYH